MTDIGVGFAEPTSLSEIGISAVMLRDLFLKTMFRQSLTTVPDLSRALRLPLGLTQELADQIRHQHLIEAIGTGPEGGGASWQLHLTDAGRKQAIEDLAQSGYFGPLPVPLKTYSLAVRRQSLKKVIITRARLAEAMNDLILDASLIDQIGPAVSAGRSILLYGPPGNGKSAISEAICSVLGDGIYVPYAIEHQGQIITVYDPLIHRAIPQPETEAISLRRGIFRPDPRYVLCRRPAVVTGGELTLDMLELGFSANQQIYQAPMQMKAAGGVFVIDDLGRQKDSPQSIINRWIIPLDTGQDLLTLQTGEKVAVPFDCLVIFSTNFHPNRLFDQAALRRIFFKIRVEGPSQEDFLRLFAQIAQKKRLPLDEAALVHLIKNKYPRVDNAYANYHAAFLIDQILAICRFEGILPQMSAELIDRAWSNLFVEESDVAH